MHVANSTFPVMHALGQDCGQQQVYQRCVMPLLMLFLEGFDASVLTYGHTKTGKSYTLFGDGFGPNRPNDEDEAKHHEAQPEHDDDHGPEEAAVDTDSEGVILRSVRDIFMNLTTHLSNRNFIIHVGWIAVGAADEVVDLLNHGIVQCQNYNELLELLQRGWRNLTRSGPSRDTHNMFTLTLEQQWVNPGDGRLQHRLSTISFCDLAAAERVVVRNNLINRDMVLHKNNGLQALDNVISCLSMVQQQPQSERRNSDLSAIPYSQTVLSTLLKDSFGGRAQTIVIVCVSAQEVHVEETLLDLQFALKVQCVRNFITMNAFVDNNTSLPGGGDGGVAEVVPDVIPIDVAATQGSSVADLIGATSYLQKLVANAEQVLIKLMRSSSLTQEERGDVEEWLYMKAECEDCLSSVDMNNMNNSRSQQAQHNLGPIHERLGEEDEDEDMEVLSCQSTRGVGVGHQRHHHLTTTTTDSESEYQRADLDDKIENLMGELRQKTDALVEQRYNEYLRTHPKPIFESVENLKPLQEAAAAIVPDKLQPVAAAVQSDNPASTPVRSGGGRRKSIQPGATLSSLELEMLNRVSAARQGINNGKDQLALPLDAEGVEMALCLPQKSSKTATGDAPLARSVALKRWQKIATDVEATVRQIRELEHTIGLKQKLISELQKSNDTRLEARARFQKKRGKLEAEYEKVKRQLAKAVASGSGRTRSAEVDRLKAMTGELEKRLQDLASIKHIATDSGENLKKLKASLVDSRRDCELLQRSLKKERRLKEALEQELDKGAGATATAPATKGDPMAVAKDASTAVVRKTTTTTTSNKHLKVVNDRLSHLDQVLREKSEHMERYQDGEKRESLRHEIRNLRRTRDHLLEQRCELARKLKREKVLTNTEERKLLECDEAIEAIDAAIEFKNELICGRRSVDTSVNGGPESVREQGEQMLMARLNKLSEEEMRTLLYKYFMKVIDLREAGRKLEIQLLSLERDRDTWEWRERMLSHAVRQARLEGERNAVLMQREHETKLTLMLRHLANETGSSGASSHDATTTMMGGGGGQEVQVYKDQGRGGGGGRLDLLSNRYKQQQQQTTTTTTKNNLFAKFHVLTQYSNEKRSMSGALIPTHNLRQLQPTSVPPVAKVTREKNKLIIQQYQEREKRGHHQQQWQQDEDQMSDSDVSNGNTLQLHFRK